MQYSTLSRKIFILGDYAFLGILAIMCLLPLINVLAISFSGSAAAASGVVKFWPVDFTIKSYSFVSGKPEFLRAMYMSLQRVVLGVGVNMFLVIITAYPLSKSRREFHLRGFYAWVMMITILFHGGLIPTYITIKNLGFIDTIWALVLPGAMPVFNLIVLMNFFRGLPKEIEEAAFMDGAGHWIILWKIYVPLSLPSLATLLLFSCVAHWNSWFDGLIYMNSPKNYPLQSYLQTVVITPDFSLLSSSDVALLAEVSDRTSKAAQIFLAAIPILILYPFLQKYFMKGLVLGSVKG